MSWGAAGKVRGQSGWVGSGGGENQTIIISMIINLRAVLLPREDSYMKSTIGLGADRVFRWTLWAGWGYDLHRFFWTFKRWRNFCQKSEVKIFCIYFFIGAKVENQKSKIEKFRKIPKFPKSQNFQNPKIFKIWEKKSQEKNPTIFLSSKPEGLQL